MQFISVIILVALLLLQNRTLEGSAVTTQQWSSVRSILPRTSTGTATNLHWPLPYAYNRPTPLHFGLFVTPDPKQNPIDPPERFIGFHAATDFEIVSGEENADVPVYAICKGPVVYSGFAKGYGGLLVQQCTLRNEEVTVLYGHLALDALPAPGTALRPGQQLSILAASRSHDADGNRKHLHLGIHRGPQLDVRGYVQREQELQHYIDPQKILPY